MVFDAFRKLNPKVFWEWSDYTAAIFHDFGTKEDLEKDKTCVMISGRKGKKKWTAVKCGTDVKKHFVCKKGGDVGSTIQIFEGAPLKWEDAEKACSVRGGHLASIESS